MGAQNPPSFSDTIRRKIDEVLPSCGVFEDFLAAMIAAGFTVKDSRKHISILAPGQQRPTRLKTLGENYTEAAIRERLGKARNIPSGGSGQREAAPNFNPAETHGTKPSLLIDIQAKLAEGKGGGYEQWATVFNLQQAAKTLLFLKENGIDSYEDLQEQASRASAKFSEITEKIKAADKRLAEISELQKEIGVYGKTREVYAQYRASGWNTGFYENHRAHITLHRAAKKYFDGLGLKKLPRIADLKKELATLLSGKKKCYAGYKTAKENMVSLLRAKDNATRMLGFDKAAAKNREKSRER